MQAVSFGLMPNQIDKRIREARERAKLSQSELARRLGVAPAAVNQWESAARRPSRERIVEIAQQTHTSAVWLLLGDTGLQEQSAIGSLSNLKTGGRAVPMVSVSDAAMGREILDNALRVYSYFPCGPDSYAITLEDDANADRYPKGTVCIMDPQQRPAPRKMVLAAVNGEPVVGQVTLETTPAGIVTVITPLAQGWPAYRSDQNELRIYAVMVASIQPA